MNVNYDSQIISLSSKEVKVFNILTKDVSSYPRQFTLTWLVNQYWEGTEEMPHLTVAEHESLRQTVARLGLKLFAARVGAVRRVSRRGRSNKGIYELAKLNDWLLSNNNICAVRK